MPILVVADLSILIPARNELWLGKTIADILAAIEGNTEIITVLDGFTDPIPEIPKDPRVKVVMLSESIGQRAATNLAARMSTAKYVAKTDAHCAFDKGFDVKLMADMQDDWTMVPVMRNLHVFDWVCHQGHRRYQGPSGPCKECGGETMRDVKWIAKTNPQSTSYCFDEEPHFQYFNSYKKQQVGDLVETMSLQGSFFMCTRKKYWELNLSDESLGSWGSQGIEVACKTWLSGGRVVVNKKTWYAHLFRTQGGDFGFPYENPDASKQGAKRMVRELFFDNKWEKQVRPLSWLIEKFWPIPGWSEEMRQKIKAWPLQNNTAAKKKAGVLYYTDNELNPKIMEVCKQRLLDSIGDMPLVTVSLKPLDFGRNIVLDRKRGHLTLFKQILAGLEALDTDYVFFAEHDILYDKSHFDFIPPENDTFYYNMNVWRLRMSDGFCLYYDHKSAHALCANREELIREYKERVRVMEVEDGKGHYRRGYEPGTRSVRRGGFRDTKSGHWRSEKPIIDIRHGENLSASKWKQSDFRSQKSCRNWKESDEIPYWGKGIDIANTLK